MRVAIKLLFAVLILFCFAVKAESNIGEVKIRRAPVEKINKYLSDRDYNYTDDYTTPVSLWDRIWYWISQHLLRPVFNTTASLWDIISYVALALTIGMLIYFVIRGDSLGLFYKNNRSNAITANNLEEDIHLMNFDLLITEAISNGQYRIAVRYLYLKSLRDLSDRNLILWKAEKTNHDYIRELQLSGFHKVFREITFLFDYAWYGDAAITENNFLQIKDSFEQFNHQLKAEIERQS